MMERENIGDFERIQKVNFFPQLEISSDLDAQVLCDFLNDPAENSKTVVEFKIYYNNDGKNESMSSVIYSEPLECVKLKSHYYVNKHRANLRMKRETDEIINYLIDREIKDGKVVVPQGWKDYIERTGVIKEGALLALTAPKYYIHFDRFCNKFYPKNEDGSPNDIALETFWRNEHFVVNTDFKKGFFRDNSQNLTYDFTTQSFSESSTRDVCTIKEQETHYYLVLFRKYMINSPVSGFSYFVSSIDPSRKLIPGRLQYAYVMDVANNYGFKNEAVDMAKSYNNATLTLKL